MLVLEKAMAPHSSILAWKIRRSLVGCSPWGRWVGHDWATSLSRLGEGNGNPLQCSCLENPRHGGACWAARQSQTRLKRLSSSNTLVLNQKWLNHRNPPFFFSFWTEFSWYLASEASDDSKLSAICPQSPFLGQTHFSFWCPLSQRKVCQ